MLSITILHTYAQDEETLQAIAKETCECINKQKIEGMSAEEVQMSLGICMMQSLGNHPGQIDYDMSDPKSMEKFGEQVGMRMATHCPEVFLKLAQEPGLMEEMLEDNNQTNDIYKLEGRVKSIKGETYLHIVLEDTQGRTQELLWLRYFVGSEQFIQNPQLLIGKKIKVEYQKIECYVPDAKNYFDRKEIKTLKVL